MAHMDDADMVRLKELLQRSGEFIAYFEHAENKMLEWRQEIEMQSSMQQQQLQALQNEGKELKEILNEAGLARLRLHVDEALRQGQSYLTAIEETRQEMMAELLAYRQQLTDLCQETLNEIGQHAKQSIERVDAQLSQYDVQHFYRAANESCEQVERTAQEAITSSRKYVHLFHWRTIALALFTTLITAFIISLYIGNEYPWDIHQHARNERDAGKLLMEAWPRLTEAERIKILGKQSG